MNRLNPSNAPEIGAPGAHGSADPFPQWAVASRPVRWEWQRHVGLFALGLLLLGLTGCAGYKLGPTNGMVAGSRSIQINPFQNKTLEPRLIAETTTALRKRIQHDGTYTLDTSGNGDVIVNGVIEEFRRSALSFEPNDVLTVRDYELSMQVHIIAQERATGKVLVDRKIIGTTSLRVGADLTTAEREAIPMMADDLAMRATSLLVDGTW